MRRRVAATALLVLSLLAFGCSSERAATQPTPSSASEVTWSPIEFHGFNCLYSVFLTDAETGWAVGDSGMIISTTDGGDSWQRQHADSRVGLSSVHFVDRLNGWAVGGVV